MATISIPGSQNVDLTVYGRGTVIAGSGNDSIDITGKGKIIVGSGWDTLTLKSGGVIEEFGKSGHDTIHLGSGHYTWDIDVQGKATVTGSFGTATISGGSLVVDPTAQLSTLTAEGGSMTLIGSSGTEFIGGAGSTQMVGGKGNETFVGGSGHDTMVAGTGHDIFEFLKSNAGGSDLIQNFVSGHDQLYLEGESLSWLKSHHDISTAHGNTYISLDGGKTTIELQGVTSLSSSNVTTHK